MQGKESAMIPLKHIIKDRAIIFRICSSTKFFVPIPAKRVPFMVVFGGNQGEEIKAYFQDIKVTYFCKALNYIILA